MEHLSTPYTAVSVDGACTEVGRIFSASDIANWTHYLYKVFT